MDGSTSQGRLVAHLHPWSPWLCFLVIFAWILESRLSASGFFPEAANKSNSVKTWIFSSQLASKTFPARIMTSVVSLRVCKASGGNRIPRSRQKGLVATIHNMAASLRESWRNEGVREATRRWVKSRPLFHSPNRLLDADPRLAEGVKKCLPAYLPVMRVCEVGILYPAVYISLLDIFCPASPSNLPSCIRFLDNCSHDLVGPHIFWGTLEQP